MGEKSNKNTTLILIIVIIVVVSLYSGYKVHMQHKDKLYNAMVSKIEEKALKCYNEDICTEKKITIKELYEKEYLETTINPLNDEYINETSYIEIINSNEAIFTIIE